MVAAEDLLSQLESVKQMWYNAGFQGNFAEKSVRDAFAERKGGLLHTHEVCRMYNGSCSPRREGVEDVECRQAL